MERVDSKAPTVFLDTNVVSRLTGSFLESLARLQQSGGARFLVSDGVLGELAQGTPSGELAALRKLDARVIVRGELIDTNGTFTTHSIDDVSIAPKYINPLEEFVLEMVRIMVGRQNGIPINVAMQKAMESQVRIASALLNEIEDPELRSKLKARRTILKSIDTEFAPSPDFKIDDHEMRNLKLGSDHLSTIKPPKIVQNILARLDSPFRSGIDTFFLAPDDVSKLRDSIQTACILLVILGFSRDTRIRKSSNLESLKGTSSQLSDAEHIAVAAGCTVFLTADKNCAKLAYAVYEHFQVNSFSVLIQKSGADFGMQSLGEDFWP
jgi:hypothetical protein